MGATKETITAAVSHVRTPWVKHLVECLSGAFSEEYHGTLTITIFAGLVKNIELKTSPREWAFPIVVNGDETGGPTYRTAGPA